MSKKTDEEPESTEPVVISYRQKHSSKAHRKAVPFKHLDNPPHRVRTLMVYLFIAVVAFIVLHNVLHVG